MVMANTDFGRPSSSAPQGAPIDVLSQERDERRRQLVQLRFGEQQH